MEKEGEKLGKREAVHDSLHRQARHCVAVWELFAARSTCPSWAAKAGMDMLQDDMMLAGEPRTHSGHTLHATRQVSHFRRQQLGSP